MKSLVLLCVVGLVALASADTKPHSRGCIYVNGRCFRECEEGTHAYAIGCGTKIPEATCDVPSPVAEPGILCDYSACYCDPPTLRDSVSGKCVQPKDCPKKE